MTLRHFIDDVELDDVTVTGVIRLGEMNGLVSSAYGADIGTSQIAIDDRSGAADIKGFARYHAIEDAATPSRVWTGYIAARKVSHSDMYEDPRARRWECDLMDLNFLLGLRICRGVGAKRPAEDDTERVAWLMGTTFMVGAGPGIFDNGFVTSADGLPFDEADYRGQYPSQVIDSVIGRRRTYWVYYDESGPTGEEVSLFYGNHNTVFGKLTQKLSNDDAEIDDDADPQTVFAFLDGQQVGRDPQDLYSGVYFQWKGTPIYRQREETVDEFGIRRDLGYQTDRVGLTSTASTQTDRLLIAHSVERDTIRGTVHVKADQVNIFREGWRVDVKQLHLPGYESAYVEMTIQKRAVREVGVGRYEVDLELTSDAPEGGPGGGDPGGTPLPPAICAAGTAEIVPGQTFDGAPTPGALSTADAALPGDPTVGNIVLCYMPIRNPSGSVPNLPVGFTDSGAAIVNTYETNGRLCYRYVQPGDTAAIAHWTGGAGGQWPDAVRLEERLGIPEVFAAGFTNDVDPGYVANSDFPGASLTPPSGRLGVIVGFTFMKRDQALLTAGTGYSLLVARKEGAVLEWAVAEKIVSSTSGSYTPEFRSSTGTVVYDDHDYGAITIALLCTASSDDNPPAPGQWVFQETVVMTGDTGATAFAYAPGSLHVYVDGVPISAAAFTETGPTSFQLGWDPDDDEVVRVDYQGV